MPTYKGSALKSQRVWSKEERESKATDRAAGEAYERESDDGRADEAHPDAGWVADWNKSQRGES